jgi:hypothetical protein
MAKILYLNTKILKIMGFFCFIFDRIWTWFFLMVKYCKFYFLKWTKSTILSDFFNWNFFPKLEQMWVKIHLKRQKHRKVVHLYSRNILGETCVEATFVWANLIQNSRYLHLCQTCLCGHLYYPVACIKRLLFSFLVIENFKWTSLEGHLSF